jgi:hypothetical protein
MKPRDQGVERDSLRGNDLYVMEWRTAIHPGAPGDAKGVSIDACNEVRSGRTVGIGGAVELDFDTSVNICPLNSRGALQRLLWRTTVWYQLDRLG